MEFSEDDVEYFRQQGIFSEEFLAYLSDFHFKGDIYALPEGTVMYPNEPILTVVAPLIDAQLVETAILAQINHQSLIATKARRICKAAAGRAVSDFGARRAHNMDAATYGARAAYIGGVVGTATCSAGQMFHIPISGTMAHSWVMFYGDEYEAFKKYAETYPDATVLLVDTYDVIHSGIPNAIRVAHEVLEPMGKRLVGIRIDSGDLAYLSKRVRKMLDDAGLPDCKIVVSNSLDEFTVSSLLSQGACIDSFGIGERLITAKSEPVFGASTSWPPSARTGRSSRASRSRRMSRKSRIRVSRICIASMMPTVTPWRIFWLSAANSWIRISPALRRPAEALEEPFVRELHVQESAQVLCPPGQAHRDAAGSRCDPRLCQAAARHGDLGRGAAF